MTIQARIFIADAERAEAAEAYVGRLNEDQLKQLKEVEGDYWLEITGGAVNFLTRVEDGSAA